MKKDFPFFEPFPAHVQSKFTKSANKSPKKFVITKFNMGIKKRRISRWFRIRWKSFEKIYQKKVISKMWQKYALFSLFTHVRQTCFAFNFFLVNFLSTFSTNSKSAWNSAFFDIFFGLKKKISRVIFALFENFEAKRAKNGSKNQKNLFSKCVLDFNFAPIKGSVFFIFVVPYCPCCSFLCFTLDSALVL